MSQRALIETFAALQIWYGFGPGSPTSAALGIGYVQELVSRLTKTRITEFSTSVNQSIVSSEILFPLEQPIYVEATHDTVMSSSKSCIFPCQIEIKVDHQSTLR